MFKELKLVQKFLGIWRNPQDVPAEPNWGFRGIREVNSGIPEFCTGGTLTKVPPVPPRGKNETERYFQLGDVFRIFRKLLKVKRYYKVSWEMQKFNT